MSFRNFPHFPKVSQDGKIDMSDVGGGAVTDKYLRCGKFERRTRMPAAGRQLGGRWIVGKGRESTILLTLGILSGISSAETRFGEGQSNLIVLNSRYNSVSAGFCAGFPKIKGHK